MLPRARDLSGGNCCPSHNRVKASRQLLPWPAVPQGRQGRRETRTLGREPSPPWLGAEGRGTDRSDRPSKTPPGSRPLVEGAAGHSGTTKGKRRKVMGDSFGRPGGAQGAPPLSQTITLGLGAAVPERSFSSTFGKNPD